MCIGTLATLSASTGHGAVLLRRFAEDGDVPESTTDTVQQLTFAGALSWQALLGIGALLLLVSALLLRREANGSRRLLAPVLWLLRAGALAVVLWMLAAPTMLTRVRHTRPRSLAVLVDCSGSMGVADSPDDLDRDPLELRWLMRAAGLQAAATTHLDTAVAQIRLAARSIVQTPQTASSRRDSRQAAAQRSQLLRAAGAALDQAVSADSRLAAPIQTIARQLAEHASTPAPDQTDQAKLQAELIQLAQHTARLADESAVTALQALRPPDRDRLLASAAQRRADLATSWLQESSARWLDRVKQQARLLAYAFDTQVSPLADHWTDASRPIEGSSGTDLTTALSQLAQDSAATSLTAAIVLTDGGHNAPSDPLKMASGLSGLPVYLVPIGQTRAARDVLLHHVQAPRGVFKNDTILIEGMIDAHGCSGEELSVELVQDDTVLETQHLPVPAETSSHVFSFRREADQIGMQHFIVRVTPLPDERVKDNNREKLSVEVTEDKIRLLLADHLPRWEHRYLRNLFKREPRVQMDELLFEPMRSSGTPAAGARWPADLDTWSQYRIVILGDVGPAQLDPAQQNLIERYVRERSGTLVLIAGEESMPAGLIGTPLERLLPVELSELPAASDPGFAVVVTTEGSTTPVLQLADDPAGSDRLWREQIVLHRLSPYSHPRQSAHVWLATAPIDGAPPAGPPQQAFLCWHDYGAGRVVYLSAPMTYRLRYRQGDTYHHRFWGQLLRWAIARDVAAGSLTVHLATDQNRYKPSDLIRVWARLTRLEGDALTGAQLNVTAEQDERALARIDLRESAENPGLYTGVLRGLPPGSIRLRVQGPDVDALLKSEGRTEPVDTVVVIDPPDDLELRSTRCNLPLLEQIAQATGGQVLPPDAVAALVSHLDLAPEVSEEVTEQPIWTRWSFLWLFVGCLTAEWTIRKLAGMA